MARRFLSGPFFNILVRLAGIEPTTPWFVAKYSIQLSYSRDRKEYISFGENGKAANLPNPELRIVQCTLPLCLRGMDPRLRADGKKGSDISI